MFPPASRSGVPGAPLPVERRGTVRVFMVDDELNVLSRSAPGSGMPHGLRPTLLQLRQQWREHPEVSQATAFSEGRIVRLVPMSGAPQTFAVSVERYVPYANLLNALKRFKLSARERDVLLLALEGRTAAETAERLKIAISTANDYVNRLLVKTGARNKSDLIAKVLGWHAEQDTSEIR